MRKALRIAFTVIGGIVTALLGYVMFWVALCWDQDYPPEAIAQPIQGEYDE